MGHLINPLSYRLYNIRYWNNNWFVFNKFNYSYIMIQDILVYRFVRKFLNKYVNLTKIGILFDNLKIVRSFNKLYLYLFIHDGFLDLMLSNWKRTRYFFKLRKRLAKRRKKYYTSLFLKHFSNRKFRFTKKYMLFRFVRLKNYRFLKNFIVLFIKQRFLLKFWIVIKNFVLFYLKKFNISYYNFDFFVFGLKKNNVSASILSEFISVRLKQYYTIFEILKSINYFLKWLLFKKRIIKGYKIMCAGRFSRKQRATYSWKTFGTISLSTMKSKLDYSYSTLALKYSNCAIKVWIRLHKKNKLVDFIV